MSAIDFAGVAMIVLIWLSSFRLAVAGTERPWFQFFRIQGIVLAIFAGLAAAIAALIGIGLLLGLPLSDAP